MDAILAARVRRQWPLFATIIVLVIFSLVHAVVFRPLADRYRTVITQAGALGLMLDPAHPAQQPAVPMRVFTMLMSNSVTAEEANARTQSGTLGPEMVQNLSALAGRHNLEVEIAEPGVVSQQAGTIEVRAHLKLRGSYTNFVAWVDDLARGDRLWVLERFTLLPGTAGRNDIEVWLGSCLLKRTGGRS